MNIIDLPINEQIRAIKREFHLMMNGVVSQSMREKGIAYRTNFGVELPRLQHFAASLPHTPELASALWKEQVRECRLLAPMLMPTNEFEPDMAELWVEQMIYPEEAECVVLHLFQHLNYASLKAFEWIAQEGTMFQLCGWMLLGRLFSKKAKPAPRDCAEILDHLYAALHDTNFHIKQAAYRTLMKFMDIDSETERQGEQLLQQLEAETQNLTASNSNV